MESSDPSIDGGTGTRPSSEQELATLRSGVLLLALRALGDLDSAEEVAQETIARTLDALRDGRVSEDLGAFARGVARHVIADRWRRVARDRDARPDVADSLHPSRGADALRVLVGMEERDRVRAALAGLTEADQEILRLTFFEGRASVELAHRLGEAEATIRKRKSRALARLRRAFLDRDAPSRSAAPADRSIEAVDRASPRVEEAP